MKVGIVDSGIDGAPSAHVIARAEFAPTGEYMESPGSQDRCGHGSRIGTIIVAAADVELLDARIFQDTLRTSAVQAGAAIDWLVARQVRLINLSFGLREDRQVLRQACVRAVACGVMVVASAPARGVPVFPASYPGIVRATGDARCAAGEISWLGTSQADFGACVRDEHHGIAGASIGCAHVSAALAAWLLQHPQASNDEALLALRARAAYCSPEHRQLS